jgi:hypothetical protein
LTKWPNSLIVLNVHVPQSHGHRFVGGYCAACRRNNTTRNVGYRDARAVCVTCSAVLKHCELCCRVVGMPGLRASHVQLCKEDVYCVLCTL